jgi:hypothetical protein
VPSAKSEEKSRGAKPDQANHRGNVTAGPPAAVTGSALEAIDWLTCRCWIDFCLKIWRAVATHYTDH